MPFAHKLSLLIFCSILFSPHISKAGSPTSFVSGASVTAGETSVEFRSGYAIDDERQSNDNRWQYRQHIDHGFNDLYALRLIVAQDDQRGQDIDYNGFTVENRFQLFNKTDHGWDGGFRISYTAQESSADSLGFKLIGQYNLKQGLSARHNINIGTDVGSNANNGIDFGVRSQIIQNINIANLSKSAVGIELFNDFGNLSEQSGFSSQDHQIGPVFKGSLKNGINFETGYRYGVSRASRDHLLKFGIAKSF